MKSIYFICYFLFLSFFAKGQIGFTNRDEARYRFIDFDIRPETRFRVAAEYSKERLYGSQFVGLTVENLTDHELNIAIKFTVHGFDGYDEVFDIGCCNGQGFGPHQTKAGEGNWMASSYKGKCNKQNGETWKDKYNMDAINCIRDITINIIRITDVTIEKQQKEAEKLAAEEKRKADQEAARIKREEEKNATEEKRLVDKKIEDEKRVAEQTKNAEKNSQLNNQQNKSSSTQLGQSNPTNNVNNSFTTVNQNGNQVKILVNTNGLDKSKYTQEQWTTIQKTADYNSKLIEQQKTQELQRQAEFKKNQDLYNQAQDKLAKEIKDREEYNKQLHQIAVQKLALQQEAVTQITSYGLQVANMFQQRANEKRAAREAAEAEAEARAERKRLYEEAEAERKAFQLEMRKSLFSQYPDVKLPLSSQNFGQEELYYFGYSFDESKIDQDNASLYTTPVFQIHKYGDGTWPYKNEILEKLSNVNGGKIFKVVGYFIDKSMAEEQRKNFTTDAEKFKISNYQAQIYKMKESTNKSTGIDFWGNPIKN